MDVAPVYPVSYGEDTILFQDTDRRVIFYAEAGRPERLDSAENLLQAALDSPIGAPRLEALAHPGDTVSIIVDDLTRPTPRQLLLKAVTERLEKIPDLHIRIILALGTHRPMTEEEVEGDLGVFARRYPVVNISYMDAARFAEAGRMADGTPIMVYREVLESDLLIGLGNIVPHIAAGWGGGGKIIMPGVCGKETTDAIHILSCLHQNVLEVCGNPDNLFRRTLEELAGKVGLAFIVNTVLDGEGNLLGVFAGDFIQAHRAGIAFARRYLCPVIPRGADILIVSANPANVDFWQGAKPYIFAHFAVRRGGVMILLLSAEEGLCGGAPAHEAAIRTYYGRSEEEVRRAAAEKETGDILGLGEAFLRLQTQGFCHTILVSRGLTESDAALLGFEKAGSLEDAVARARRRVGARAAIGIIPQGGDLLCQVEREVGVPAGESL